MVAQGVNKGEKYRELNFAIGEYEDELEYLNLTSAAKNTQPKTFKHSNYACIGTSTCFG